MGWEMNNTLQLLPSRGGVYFPIHWVTLLSQENVGEVATDEFWAQASRSLAASVLKLLEPWDYYENKFKLVYWAMTDIGPIALAPNHHLTISQKLSHHADSKWLNSWELSWN